LGFESADETRVLIQEIQEVAGHLISPWRWG
jgi:hypothetical protein